MINGGKWTKDVENGPKMAINATILPNNFVGMRTIIMS